MSYLRPDNFDVASVEAMLQAAGGYVAPSEDLRPRVLEEARRLRSGGQRRWRLTLAGGSALAAVLLLSAQASTLSQSLSEATPSQRVADLVESSHATSKSTSEGLWALVDAFFKVRSEQAEAFRPDSDVPATDAPCSDVSVGESSEGVTQMPTSDGSF
jgi:hypothetical protein